MRGEAERIEFEEAKGALGGSRECMLASMGLVEPAAEAIEFAWEMMEDVRREGLSSTWSMAMSGEGDERWNVSQAA